MDETTKIVLHASRMLHFLEQNSLLHFSKSLTNSGSIKPGAKIGGDTRKLFEDWEIQIQGIVKLAMLASEVDRQTTMERHGLKTRLPWIAWSAFTLDEFYQRVYKGRMTGKGR